MKHINIDSFRDVINAEKSNSTIDFINVCTPVEYNEKHISGVRNVPLDEIEKHISEFNSKKTIYVHCRSGNRSKKAIEILEALGVVAEMVNVEGGLMAWEQAKFDTTSLSRKLPLMRQVFLCAGILIITAHLLAYVVDTRFAFLSLLVGIGLTISGLTGWCGMALLLSKMPWNK